MKTFKATIRGLAPLMMHNERLADPTATETRALKAKTSSRKKTDEDLEEIKRLEWFGGIYADDKGRPSIPAGWVWAALIAGAKKSKQGPQAKAGIFDAGPHALYFPLKFEGPKTLEALFADGRFTDTRGVGVQGSRVMRTRPVFPNWTAEIEVMYDPDTIDGADVEKALAQCGKLLGLGDYRPRFGRFEVLEVSHVDV